MILFYNVMDIYSSNDKNCLLIRESFMILTPDRLQITVTLPEEAVAII